jgi:hypothetical protein
MILAWYTFDNRDITPDRILPLVLVLPLEIGSIMIATGEITGSAPDRAGSITGGGIIAGNG